MTYEALFAETVLMRGHRPNYRQAAAVDGWQKVFAFFGKHLR
jgi:dienelactone hydrolase